MNYFVDGDDLTGIADAIRSKTGGSAALEFPDDFTSAISGLHTTASISKTTAQAGWVFDSNVTVAAGAVQDTGESLGTNVELGDYLTDRTGVYAMKGSNGHLYLINTTESSVTISTSSYITLTLTQYSAVLS